VVAVGAAALLGAAAAGGWLATRSSSHKVAPAAETLAVLPFHASGPGMEFLGEGMMDLLATNLRGVGGITTVEPRAVLREWGSEGSGGSDDLTRAIAVGRDLNAGSVVLGNAVSTGGRVRVSADLYSVQGERLGRAQVDGPSDSVLALVDRLSVALVRDIWRSKEPIPHLRVAALTTDSIEALRAYLQGESYYRRLNWDSALTAYNRAVEVDSTFSLAHLRRAQVYGWTGGYGSKESHAAVAAGVRYAGRLSPRDRRLLLGYQLFDQGKPAAIDSVRAFVAANPEDLEGWFLLGEARHHIKTTDPAPPESVTALFDSVIRRDSTLFPAFIHPLDLALLYRDSARFARYFPAFARTAPPAKVRALETAKELTWGPPPTTRAIAASLEQSYWPIVAGNSFYHQDAATSDSVLQAMARVRRAVPPVPHYQGLALTWKAQALAGMGQWHEARAVLDTLRRIDPGKTLGIQAWAVALGLASPAYGSLVDSAVRAVPPGPEAEYAKAMRELLRSRVTEARQRIARALATRDTAMLSRPVHGLLVATDGWGAILQGDSVGGIRRMRDGLALASGPNEENAFLRLQFALALAARPESREEGIRWLKYGFDQQALYLPLTYLALGHAYELGGQRDSAVVAYNRFLRLWDKADPDLQGRVKEARAALQELSRERPSSP
jgi:tetratricopeptide (TPR) repeat protein/TolB-like protein